MQLYAIQCSLALTFGHVNDQNCDCSPLSSILMTRKATSQLLQLDIQGECSRLSQTRVPTSCRSAQRRRGLP